jgi:NADPH-dependent 7-cyano-7-deazaguanine reductase QueF
MKDKNPLIEQSPEDTLVNIHSVLLFVQEFHAESEFNENTDNRIYYSGLSLIIKCVNEALYYEMDRLEKSDKKPKETAIFEA